MSAANRADPSLISRIHLAAEARDQASVFVLDGRELIVNRDLPTALRTDLLFRARVLV